MILYRKFRFLDRRTITDHLYSFSRYAKQHEYFYLDVSSDAVLTSEVLSFPYDIVILHYTFLVQRMDGGVFDKYYSSVGPKIAQLSGIKVLIPHDEYSDTARLWKIARDCQADHIFASCYPQDYPVLYPLDKVGENCQIHTVLTGYVEPSLVKKYSTKSNRRRDIDIGYRALDSGYLYGLHGWIKVSVARAFIKAAKEHPELVFDVALTGHNKRKTKYGNQWFRFLRSCKAAVGCLGGSSIMDADGSIKASLATYMKQHPTAAYAEAEKNCFPHKDGKITAFLLGPRIFEYAICKTCPILVEGDYHGILYPEVHYISLKKDFSNMDEVLERVKDTAYCAQMAERCYRDLVLSEDYRYDFFANNLLDTVAENQLPRNSTRTEQAAWKKLRRNPYYRIVPFFTLLKNAAVGVCGQFLFCLSPRLHAQVKVALGID